MTEKRVTYTNYDDGTQSIYDNETLQIELARLEYENEELQRKYDAQRELFMQLDLLKNNLHQDKIDLKKENEKIKSILKEVLKLLEEEVDLFSDKTTEHDLNAFRELREFDNKDAYYIAIATKKAIKLLKELQEND